MYGDVPDDDPFFSSGGDGGDDPFSDPFFNQVRRVLEGVPCNGAVVCNCCGCIVASVCQWV